MIKKVFICVDIIKQQRLASDIMGGRVLELETDKIMAEAEARGEARGIMNATYICFKNCLDRGMTFEDAQALSGATDEAAKEHYQRWLKEQKNK